MLFSWKHTRGALCCHIFISATKTFTGHMFQSIELYSYWHICQSWNGVEMKFIASPLNHMKLKKATGIGQDS